MRPRTLPLLLLAALLAALLSTFSSPHSPIHGLAHAAAPTIERLGYMGGTVNSVAPQGTVAYVGDHNGLTVLDTSVPVRLTILTRMAFPGRVYDIQVVGARAYLATTDQGLQIVDVATAGAPTILGRYNVPIVGWNTDPQNHRTLPLVYLEGRAACRADRVWRRRRGQATGDQRTLSGHPSTDQSFHRASVRQDGARHCQASVCRQSCERRP